MADPCRAQHDPHSAPAMSASSHGPRAATRAAGAASQRVLQACARHRAPSVSRLRRPVPLWRAPSSAALCCVSALRAAQGCKLRRCRRAAQRKRRRRAGQEGARVTTVLYAAARRGGATREVARGLGCRVPPKAIPLQISARQQITQQSRCLRGPHPALLGACRPRRRTRALPSRRCRRSRPSHRPSSRRAPSRRRCAAEREEARAGGCVPHLGRVVSAGGGQLLAVWRPRQR